MVAFKTVLACLSQLWLSPALPQVGQLPGVAQAAIVAENEGALVAYLELDDTRDASGAVTGSQPLKRIEVGGEMEGLRFFHGFI